MQSSYFLGEMHGNVNSIVCGIILLLICDPFWEYEPYSLNNYFGFSFIS